MNKNASVEKIKSVVSHPNADRLDLVKILGYQCVTERGLHKEGDLVIYIQPDSVLPENAVWAESYRKYSPGRIKAVKLRGQWSEGIIVKPEQVDFILLESSDCIQSEDEGRDVSDELCITHYEPPLPQDLSAKGLLPFGIPKTDEERWENMVDDLPFGEIVDVTLKIDGQSWTAYYNVESDSFGVCGRTLEFKDDAHNKYTAHIERYGIREKLSAYCKQHGVSLAIRGESYGQGIQAFAENPHSKENAGLAIFSVYRIQERKYARKGDEFYFPLVSQALDLPHVPILEENVVLTQTIVDKYSTGLKQIDGKSFEGVVINHGGYSLSHAVDDVILPDGSMKKIENATKQYLPNSFKVINKNYDMSK
jgi:RNA ligase (TIGR02306 family)